MSKTINKVILANFILNETYARKILPFFHEDYFAEPVDKLVFNEIESFIESYNSIPTKEALTIAIHGNSEISKELSNQALALIEDVDVDYQKPNVEWLAKESE